MNSSPTGLLRSVELRLLRCTLPSPPRPLPPPPPPISNPLIELLLAAIERGDYATALSSSSARAAIFSFADSYSFIDSTDSAAGFYDQVEKSLDSFLRSNTAESHDVWLQVLDLEPGTNSPQFLDSEDVDGDVEWRFALVLCIGVAALLAFLQQNVTGPIGDFDPFPLLFPRGEGTVKGGGEWDRWASMQMESVGSHLDAKYSLLQYIVYAKILLSKTNNMSKEGRISCVSGSRGSSWWLCRRLLLQQRILDELSSSLYDLLQVFKEEILHMFGRPENIISYWGSMLYDGEDLQIASVVQLEAGILEYKYGRVDSSRLHLGCAQESCGMHLSVTGVLGFRRIHQVEATSQRVLVTNTDQHKHNGQSSAKSSVLQSDSFAFEEKNDPRSDRHFENCDVLLTPRLLENGNANEPNEIVGNTAQDASLNEIQQAVVLAQCLSLSRSSREDELSSWDMAPYIEAIDAQRHSCHIIQNSCDILRIRWESSRNCTRERAFLMMDKLVAVIYDPSPVAAVRIQLAFAVEIPTIPAMRKDYAFHCISCGMISEALKIFEDLELWNALIDCYCFLGKKATALDLIKLRLRDKPTDARLWLYLFVQP